MKGHFISITVFRIPLCSIIPSGEDPSHSWLSPSFKSQIPVSFITFNFIYLPQNTNNDETRQLHKSK